MIFQKYLGLLCGLLLVGILFFNGSLANFSGPLFSSTLVHFIGTVTAFIILLFKKDIQFRNLGAKWWSYSAGILGTAIVVIHVTVFSGHLDVTTIMALVLLGQMGLSLFLDAFGLLGLQKRILTKYDFLQILFVGLGCYLLIFKDKEVL